MVFKSNSLCIKESPFASNPLCLSIIPFQWHWIYYTDFTSIHLYLSPNWQLLSTVIFNPMFAHGCLLHWMTYCMEESDHLQQGWNSKIRNYSPISKINHVRWLFKKTKQSAHMYRLKKRMTPLKWNFFLSSSLWSSLASTSCHTPQQWVMSLFKWEQTMCDTWHSANCINRRIKATRKLCWTGAALFKLAERSFNLMKDMFIRSGYV